MEKECREDTKGMIAREQRSCQEHRRHQEHRMQQSRNRARHMQVRKIVQLRRTVVVAILIGLSIAGIFLLTNSQSGDIQNVSKPAIEKTVKTDTERVVANSNVNTLAMESQGEAAEEDAEPARLSTDEAGFTTVILHDIPDTDTLSYPFNQISADWVVEELNGWWSYTIPDGFERAGGYLPDIVQVYTYRLCEQNRIRYSLVLAIMEIESGYQYDALSETNNIGYMQVNYKWQKDKMPDMTEKALYNPYVNIRVGIEYLVELSEEFSTEEAVLTAYHYGTVGAYSRCYKDTSITSDYADKVLEAAERIEAVLKARAATVKGGDADAPLD